MRNSAAITGGGREGSGTPPSRCAMLAREPKLRAAGPLRTRQPSPTRSGGTPRILA
jgi:hypothetical protein